MILSLLTWKIKAILIGAGIVAALWWYQHALTKAYERGAAEKQESMLKDEARRIEEATAADRAQLEMEREMVVAGRAALESDRIALGTMRRQLTAELNRGIGMLATRDLELRNELSSTPDIDLVPRFRDVLARARSAESARTSQPR